MSVLINSAGCWLREDVTRSGGGLEAPPIDNLRNHGLSQPLVRRSPAPALGLGIRFRSTEKGQVLPLSISSEVILPFASANV